MVVVTLLPDGKTLAVLSAPTTKDRVRLITLDVKSMTAGVLAQSDHDDVDDVHWINNHRLVHELDDHQAAAGDRNKALGSGLWACAPLEWQVFGKQFGTSTDGIGSSPDALPPNPMRRERRKRDSSYPLKANLPG